VIEWVEDDGEGGEETYVLRENELSGALWQAVVIQVWGILGMARDGIPHQVIDAAILEMILGPDIIRWLGIAVEVSE
jgi:hypothetical protein